jgi:hypothetical protein
VSSPMPARQGPAYRRPVAEADISFVGRTLGLHLDVQLDRRPIRGRLATRWGGEERFEGWLGFAAALTRLHELQPPNPKRDEGSDR